MPEVAQLAERIVKFLLWAAGGWRLMLCGPRKLCLAIKAQYTKAGARAFDVDFMAGVYGKPMVVELRPLAEMPQAYERALLMDNRTNGYRLGFDLGASDFKKEQEVLLPKGTKFKLTNVTREGNFDATNLKNNDPPIIVVHMEEI